MKALVGALTEYCFISSAHCRTWLPCLLTVSGLRGYQGLELGPVITELDSWPQSVRRVEMAGGGGGSSQV